MDLKITGSYDLHPIVISNRGGRARMNKYEFTYSFMKPFVHVYKVEIEAYSDSDAYYHAMYNIAMHLYEHSREFEAPEEAKITCIKKGKINGI